MIKNNNKMASEIERKFFVKNDTFKALAEKTIYIEQGYLTTEKDCVVRVRIADEKSFITIKIRNKYNDIIRSEWEYPIPLEEAREMMKICGLNTIHKTRYLVPVGKHIFEVDVFHSDNEGLVISEIELSAEDEPFIRPDWLGEEVTAIGSYYNFYLAQHPYKEWKNSISEFIVPLP